MLIMAEATFHGENRVFDGESIEFSGFSVM